MNVKPLAFIFLMLFGWAIAVPAWSEDIYIIPELLDMNKIRAEEQLDQSIQLTRVYIFLAVLDGEEYKTYTADGQKDVNLDGSKTMEKPNNLTDYLNTTPPVENVMKVTSDFSVCYIAGMPNFDVLFPKVKAPIENNTMVAVHTSTTLTDAKRLTGEKTIPILGNNDSSEGIERFVAFYNKKGGDGDDKDVIASFGFIEIQMKRG